ncbi:hypothetical protein L2E82_25020 [Cichorium intybus]|uniref:Uncharacterized protein n=1 Tax=Cichorium intybus TaxID=13427 RepID=A0ACB9E2H4_CICIN|nr:hypothetical protein L2E82_25020 [Cichorium intybus]
MLFIFHPEDEDECVPSLLRLIMAKVTERYNKAKDEHHHMLNPTMEVKFWQDEAARLRQQLHYLQHSNRQLSGEGISGLSVKDLQNLENQLEMSLKNVRIKKEQIFTEDIKELHKKGSLIVQQNEELHKQLNLMCHEKVELLKISARNALQLSQPQEQMDDMAAEAMNLRVKAEGNQSKYLEHFLETDPTVERREKPNRPRPMKPNEHCHWVIWFETLG